jgi:RNA polymerase sigma-70 factor, ECF subfamily
MVYKSDISDEELFDLMKKDNSNALKLLFSRHYENLCYFAFTYLKERSVAEEAALDVFANVWEKRKNIVITGKVKTYFYTAVKNYSLNYLQKNRVFFERLDDVDRLLIGSQPGADDPVYYEELKQEIDKLIDRLPEKRKLIFKMNKYDGLSYQEIASILSISVSTVKNQMIKAVKHLNSNFPALKKIISLFIFFPF